MKIYYLLRKFVINWKFKKKKKNLLELGMEAPGTFKFYIKFIRKLISIFFIELSFWKLLNYCLSFFKFWLSFLELFLNKFPETSCHTKQHCKKNIIIKNHPQIFIIKLWHKKGTKTRDKSSWSNWFFVN